MNRIVVRRRAVRRAFTLLEVLMVIVILGILAAIIVPQFGGTQEKAKIDLTRTQIQQLGSDLERFKLHCGSYPRELGDLLTKPEGDEFKEWAGPYIKAPAKDAWSRPLNYKFPGEYNQNGYDLWSSGPNGQAGDADDIANWEKK